MILEENLHSSCGGCHFSCTAAYLVWANSGCQAISDVTPLDGAEGFCQPLPLNTTKVLAKSSCPGVFVGHFLEQT